MNGRQKKAPSRITIERTANGGHLVEHHYDNSGSGESYSPPEKHAFTSHKDLMAHVHKHTAADVGGGEASPTGVGKVSTATPPGPRSFGAGMD